MDCRRESSLCRCGRPSTNRRSSVISAISTDTFDNEDADEDCDICQSLASRKASRVHLMQTLRHFLRDDPPAGLVVEEEEDSSVAASLSLAATPSLSTPKSTLEIPLPDEGICVDESAVESVADVMSAEQVKSSASMSTGSMCSGLGASVEEQSEASDTACQGGFHEVLQRGLIEGRVGAKVYGSQVKDNHVEFLVKIQVGGVLDILPTILSNISYMHRFCPIIKTPPRQLHHMRWKWSYGGDTVSSPPCVMRCYKTRPWLPRYHDFPRSRCFPILGK
jgi:hypothetical protein